MMDHIHDCTGLDQTCPCGYRFTVPPISVSIDVMNGRDVIISEGFSCDHYGTVAAALREAADKLDGLAKADA